MQIQIEIDRQTSIKSGPWCGIDADVATACGQTRISCGSISAWVIDQNTGQVGVAFCVESGHYDWLSAQVQTGQSCVVVQYCVRQHGIQSEIKRGKSIITGPQLL